MPELLKNVPPDKFTITRLVGLSLLRVKGLCPEHGDGGTSFVLAGLDLPVQIGATSTGAIRALCTGPGEWLLVAEDLRQARCVQIAAEFRARGFVPTELSDGLAAFALAGSMVRDLLSKGCGLDLHALSFAVGRCARTRFAQIAVVLECRDETSRFILYVPRSYADWLEEWLKDAALEFGE